MLARLTPLLLLSLLTALTACYEAPEDPVPDGKEAELTTVTSQLDEACYGSCAERSAAVYDRCIERGHSRGYCGGLVYDQWRHCNDRCDQPADCEEQCERRGAQYLRACSRRGVPRDRCETQARRLTRSCVHRVCEERVDIPPCARRCQRRAYKVLRRCLRRGGHPNVCGRYAGAHFDSCVQRTCEIPTCDEIRCPDGHHCEMNDEGPACVADPEPRTCDEVQCVEGTHCVMHDDGPQCVRNAPTCDDVDCPDAHHCEMSDGQPVCVPDHVPSCEERCDRAAAQVYQHCTEGGEAPDVCRERAEEHADACVADCPRAPETCDDVACPDEHHCQVMDGQAVCVPDRLQRSCENTVCPPRHHCHETDNGPVCARDHGCEDTICPDGWSCEEMEGIAQCFDGEPTCVQRCYRRRDARYYNCVHHDLEDADVCAEQAEQLRAECVNHCG